MLLLSSNTNDKLDSSDIENMEIFDTPDETNISAPTSSKLLNANASTSLTHTKKSPLLKKISKPRSNPYLNRNVTLSNMRQDRKEYNNKRLILEKEKVELQKQRLDILKERNLLLSSERNDILRNQRCADCLRKFNEI